MISGCQNGWVEDLGMDLKKFGFLMGEGHAWHEGEFGDLTYQGCIPWVYILLD
jgi:hypothetical protein